MFHGQLILYYFVINFKIIKNNFTEFLHCFFNVEKHKKKPLTKEKVRGDLGMCNCENVSKTSSVT